MLKNRGRKLNKDIVALRMLILYTQIDAGQVSKSPAGCQENLLMACRRKEVDGNGMRKRRKRMEYFQR